MEIFIWLGIMILMLAIEAVTVGLTTIWFAAGALAAVIASAAGLGIVWEIILFSVISTLLLFLTRPLAIKYMNPYKVRTNYEDALGKTVQVIERVENAKGTGRAVLGGLEWMARMQDDAQACEEGALAKVASIEGVKLILVPLEDGRDGKKL